MMNNVDYLSLEKKVNALCQGVDFDISLLANISALIYENLNDLNWVGFYLFKDDALLLGPFQGKVACTRIEIGKGVCGTCVKKGCSLNVADVHQFPGHIACDSASNAELVIPIYRNKEIYGVLDLDSPLYKRFSIDDQKGLESIVKILESYLVLLAK